ncbi:MAG: hypothetical protein ACLPKB_17980 [Xanthobacteraceae bacterium]
MSELSAMLVLAGGTFYVFSAGVADARHIEHADLTPAKVLTVATSTGSIGMSPSTIPHYQNTMSGVQLPGVAHDPRPASSISPRDLPRISSTLALSGDIYRGLDVEGMPLRFFVDT